MLSHPDSAFPVVKVEIDPSKRGQEIRGFGGNLTEASILSINALPTDTRAALMQQLFNPKSGLALNFLRVPVGASDFVDANLGFYTYSDLQPGQTDPKMKLFSLGRDQKTVAFLKEAKAINPSLHIMLSPWSAPDWMKTGTLDPHINGRLAPEHYDDYAKYLVKTVRVYELNGIPVDAVTVVNEPLFFDNQWYISMPMTTEEQMAFIAKSLGPAFAKAKIGARILGLDHNYENAGEGVRMMDDPKVRRYLGGMAFHCYGGVPEQMQVLRDKYPSVTLYQTECTTLNDDDYYKATLGSWLRAQVLQPNVAAALAWNLALFAPGERPSGLDQACGACTGLVTIKKSGEFVLGPEIYGLAHASRFLRPHAHAVATTQASHEGVTSQGYLNSDGERVLIMTNESETSLSVVLREAGRGEALLELGPKSAATIVW